MKGDFSRQTFDKKKRYSGVLLQQGRVQLDADWNEQQAITQSRFESLTQDAIGPSGAPLYNAGFAITVKNNKLMIGKGRYYLDGLLCENFDDVAYDSQPDLLSPPDILQALKAAGAQTGFVYLDVWQRHLTALDDRYIREKALGGPDTATRLKTLWQVKVLPINPNSIDLERVQSELAAMLNDWKTTAAWASPDRQGALVALNVYSTRVINIVQAPLSQLQDAQRANPQAMQQTLQTFQADTAQVNTSLIAATKDAKYALAYATALKKEFDRILREATQINCRSRFNGWDDLVAASTGLMNARTVAQESSDNPCLIPPTAGYQRLENQLYRVEIHQGGTQSTATFKWSRENGSVVVAIEEINGKNVRVQDTGRDDVLGFASGQWVEVVDDLNELSGNVSQLVQIDTINQATRVITMKSALGPVDKKFHPKLRRWEQSGLSATASGVSMTNNWMSLESGIQVQFLPGTYKTGDYWLIPARTATGEIEWPPFQEPNTNPIPQPPSTARHSYGVLATIRLAPGNTLQLVEDCRRFFAPLSPPAMHVLSTNWANDDYIPLDRFNRDGLQIRLDDTPFAASVKDAAVIITAEVQLPFNVTAKSTQPVGTGGTSTSQTFDLTSKLIIILEGECTVDSNLILWRPTVDTLNKLVTLVRLQAPVMMRVALKGHVIWCEHGNLRLHLDGQSFGQPGLRDGGRGTRTALGFPSGAGTRASDFESWMYLDVPSYGYFYGLVGIGSDLIKPPSYSYVAYYYGGGGIGGGLVKPPTPPPPPPPKPYGTGTGTGIGMGLLNETPKSNA